MEDNQMVGWPDFILLLLKNKIWPLSKVDDLVYGVYDREPGYVEVFLERLGEFDRKEATSKIVEMISEHMNAYDFLPHHMR